jgi:hypothetical protein
MGADQSAEALRSWHELYEAQLSNESVAERSPYAPSTSGVRAPCSFRHVWLPIATGASRVGSVPKAWATA